MSPPIPEVPPTHALGRGNFAHESAPAVEDPKRIRPRGIGKGEGDHVPRAGDRDRRVDRRGEFLHRDESGQVRCNNPEEFQNIVRQHNAHFYYLDERLLLD